MEETFEKRYKLNQVHTLNKSECEETLMLLRYLYRREDDPEYRIEIRQSMEVLERRLKELRLTDSPD